MKSRASRKTRHRREVSKQSAALAAAIQILHSRIEKLEQSIQKRRIGFQLEGVVDGGGIQQDREDD